MTMFDIIIPCKALHWGWGVELPNDLCALAETGVRSGILKLCNPASCNLYISPLERKVGQSLCSSFYGLRGLDYINLLSWDPWLLVLVAWRYWTIPWLEIAKLSHPASIGWVALSSLVRRRRSSVRPASVTSPLISTIWCSRPYKPYIFC